MEEDGSVALEEQGSSRPGLRPGRYAVVPSAPDLLLGVRLPSRGGPLPAGRVLIAGDLEGISFPALVGLLTQGRKTGVLRVLSRSGDRTLVFAGGELRGASSSHPGDRLGEIAVRLGLLDRAALDSVLAADPEGRRLGRRLVEAKLLNPHQVWRAIQDQVATIFHAILLGEPAPFLFTDEPVEAVSTAPALSAQTLLMEGLRRQDELGLFRKRIPSSEVKVRRGRDPEVSLAPSERAVVDAVARQERSVAELATHLKLPEFEVTRVVYHLAEAGLVNLSNPGGKRYAEVQPSSADLHPIARVFSQIYREIVEAVSSVGRGAEVRAALVSALDPAHPAAPLLGGLGAAADGTLPEAELLARAAREKEPRETLLAALQELMFFLLFAASEHLPSDLDEELNRRVKLMFGMLQE